MQACAAHLCTAFQDAGAWWAYLILSEGLGESVLAGPLQVATEECSFCATAEFFDLSEGMCQGFVGQSFSLVWEDGLVVTPSD